jgi:hypothetical protein
MTIRHSAAQDPRSLTERKGLGMRSGQRLVLLGGGRILPGRGRVERAAFRGACVAERRRARLYGASRRYDHG